MKQQVWSSPKTAFEEFVPQVYCAACGDSGIVYKFTCDAPGGPLYYFPNKPANLDAPNSGEEGTLLGYGYHPCEAFHEAQAKSGFYWGYVDKSHGEWGNDDFEWLNGILDEDEKVIVWKGENNDNGHATTQLDMKKWETAKS